MRFETSNKKKIFNDPVYGFVSIPDNLIFDLIEHPYFQRLRRIKQLGLSHLVYPGALHTRFQHSLGAMHLMQNAISVLRAKGNEINVEEVQAVMIAILLHDMGHGPYSHTLEHSIVQKISHEKLSYLFLKRMNKIFDSRLELAIPILDGSYHKPFLHELVSSQLDMDRIDYLKRDSFFTGVSEGAINADRLIAMLDVQDGRLVIEAKGIYSVEKFIIARRLMYWQVYLHKTVLSAEFMLRNTLKRARQLVHDKKDLPGSPALLDFLQNEYEIHDFENHEKLLHEYAALDDFDVLMALKLWTKHDDQLLSYLSQSIIDRKLFKVELQTSPFQADHIEAIKQNIMKSFKLPEEVCELLLIHDSTSNHAYKPGSSNIHIKQKDGKLTEISETSEQLTISVLSKPVTKHFVCYPKGMMP